MGTEADACRTLILPKLYAAGWTDEQIAELDALLPALLDRAFKGEL